MQEDLTFWGVQHGVTMMSQMFDRGLDGFEMVGISIWVGHHKFHILLYIMNDFDYEEILFIDQEHISLGHK